MRLLLLYYEQSIELSGEEFINFNELYQSDNGEVVYKVILFFNYRCCWNHSTVATILFIKAFCGVIHTNGTSRISGF
jgi:hypothetical protein